MLKFAEMPDTVLQNFNGGDGAVSAKMFKDDKVRIMRATIPQGSSIGSHTHATSCEVVYVLAGQANCLIDGQEEIVRAGECHYCPKGSTHSVKNVMPEPLEAVCVVPEQ